TACLSSEQATASRESRASQHQERTEVASRGRQKGGNRAEPAGQAPQPWRRLQLEVEAHLCRVRPPRHIVGSAKGRKEVVRCPFIADVDRGQPEAPAVAIAVEQIVLAQGQIE